MIWVRLAFVALFMADGLGALLYAAFWFFVPLGVGGVDAQKPPSPVTAETTPDGRRRLVTRKPDKGQIVALLLMVVVAMIFVGSVDLTNGARAYLWPTVLVGAGVALVWRQADNARRARWMEVGRRRRTVTLLRAVAGVLLVTAGASGIFVLRGSGSHLGAVLQAALAVLVGVALLAGPYLVRMTQDLSEERLMRIRAQERAEVAAHVHDSVLHTLTLIQRNADNPGEVRRLARAQERDLRAWLHKPEGNGKDEDEEPATLAEAVKRNAAEVEDKHGVPWRSSSWATAPRREDRRADAGREEAMVNAAKYGGEEARSRSTRRSRGGRCSCPSGTAVPGSTSTRYPPTVWASENRSSAVWNATAARRGCARCRTGNRGRAGDGEGGEDVMSEPTEANAAAEAAPADGTAEPAGPGGAMCAWSSSTTTGCSVRGSRRRSDRPSRPVSRWSARPPTSTRRSRSSRRRGPRWSCSTCTCPGAAASKCCGAARR